MEKNKKTNIFLIDDDDFLLEIYAVKFKSSGFNVEVARGGEEALAKIKNGFLPEVILLDILMPKMDGFEFLQALKENNMLDKFLFVVLSNKGQKDDMEKGKKFGVSEYIIKANYTPSEVVEKVKDLLSKSNVK
ncbi:response regulator [Patescibacteria group bacterium]|nr:response regulator [Patescibacteria group bacterium]